jgi:hypothetical protein
MLEQVIIGDHEDLENSLKIKESQCIVCSTKEKSGEPEQHAPDATRGCMENASLNTGANCKRYICTILYVMKFQTRELFRHKTYIKIYRKMFSFLQAW